MYILINLTNKSDDNKRYQKTMSVFSKIKNKKIILLRERIDLKEKSYFIDFKNQEYKNAQIVSSTIFPCKKFIDQIKYSEVFKN